MQTIENMISNPNVVSGLGIFIYLVGERRAKIVLCNWDVITGGTALWLDARRELVGTVLHCISF